MWNKISNLSKQLFVKSGVINQEKEILRQYIGSLVDSPELSFLYTNDPGHTHDTKIFPFAYHHEFTYLQKIVLLTKLYPGIENYLEERAKESSKLENTCGYLYFGKDPLTCKLTVLHLACIYANILSTERCISILIDAGVNIDAVDNLGRSALYLAVHYGSMRKGPDINEHDINSEYISINAIKYLLAAGINVDLASIDGSTVLHQIIKCMTTKNHEQVFNMIMETKPNVNASNYYGWYPSHLVAISAGANRIGVMPKTIIESVEKNLILELKKRENKANGANRTNKGNKGNKWNNTNKNINYVDLNMHGDKDFQFNWQLIITSLVQTGAKLNVKDRIGCTPLHYAAMLCATVSDISMIKMLLDSGANVNEVNHFNATALDLAVGHCGEYSNEDAIQILIDAGTNVNSKDINGLTSLHLACFNTHCNISNVIKMLIHNKANINEQDKKGETPLHKATKMYYRKLTTNVTETCENIKNIIITLIEAKVDLTMCNNMGDTALDFAIFMSTSKNSFTTKNNNFTVVEILFDAMIDANVIDLWMFERRNKQYNDVFKKYSRTRLENVAHERMKYGECFLCLSDGMVVRCKHDHGVCMECLMLKKDMLCDICNYLFIR